MAARIWWCALALVMSALLVGCGDGPTGGRLVEQPLKPEPAGTDDGDELPPAKTPPPSDVLKSQEGVRTVSFPSGDGTRLIGKLFGDDQQRKRGVLLVHGADATMGAWYPAAQDLMKRGYAALAFNLRGFGQSEGTKDAAKYPEDVTTAMEILYVNGVDEIAIVASGVGGTAAVISAAEWDRTLKALVLVDATATSDDLDASDEAGEIDVPARVYGNDSRELANMITGAEYEAETPDDAEIVAFLSEELGE